MRRRSSTIAISVTLLFFSASLASGADVDLRTVPDLQKRVTGNFLNPTSRELVDSIRKQTGVNLTLDDSVIQDRPIQGHSVFQKVSAWIVLEQLAQNKYILGSWRQEGSAYRLVATYSGSPPPAAEPLPKEIITGIRASTESQFGPLEGAAANPPPKPEIKRQVWNWLLSAGGVVALVAIALIWGYRRRRSANIQSPDQQPKATAAAKETVEKSG